MPYCSVKRDLNTLTCNNTASLRSKVIRVEWKNMAPGFDNVVPLLHGKALLPYNSKSRYNSSFDRYTLNTKLSAFSSVSLDFNFASHQIEYPYYLMKR